MMTTISQQLLLVIFLTFRSITSSALAIIVQSRNPVCFVSYSTDKILSAECAGRRRSGGKFALTSLLASADDGKSQTRTKLSEADKERLLLSEPALNAFIVAEMEHFLLETIEEIENGYGRSKWQMRTDEKISAGLIQKDGTVINNDYADATKTMNASQAVDLICNTTRIAFTDGYNQQGLLSALGSAICFFRNYFREPRLIAACEQVGLSDYDVAHHITDMYHHKSFRGAYTKTLTPSGNGEIAARIAVGLEDSMEPTDQSIKAGVAGTDQDIDDDDECLLWSPTTPGVCLNWKSENEAWRKKRFERIQMEGTRDPRRGGSGTTR